MPEWTRKPAVDPNGVGCLNCGCKPKLFAPDDIIAVGFGYAGINRDGVAVLTEQQRDDCIYGREAEEMALADPDHDWQIVIHGPLSGRTYQRHEPGQWVLIQQDEGFA